VIDSFCIQRSRIIAQFFHSKIAGSLKIEEDDEGTIETRPEQKSEYFRTEIRRINVESVRGAKLQTSGKLLGEIPGK
jgi:hypothetical protein